MRERDFDWSHLLPIHWDSWVACQVLCIALLLVARASAQGHGSPSLPTLPSGAPVGSRQDYDIPSHDPLEEARRMQALNIARQKAMVSDANKLLKLTTELNEEIAHSNSDTLTSAQIRKLAQIEKLAHSVSEKMSAVVLPNTGIQSPWDPRVH
ncbi:MAG: hypothetical protein WBQ94_09095 [Terracidiphilus sp.]